MMAQSSVPLLYFSGTQAIVKGVTTGLEGITDVIDATDQLSETVESVSPAADTIVDTVQTSFDEIDVTDVDSVLDETEDIVEGATEGVGHITDSMDVTGLDGVTETVGTFG